MNNITKVKIIDKIFIMGFIIVLGIGFMTLFLPAKAPSVIENRGLNKIDFPDIKAFLKGDFQDNLEVALTDQFILSRTIKEVTIKATNFIDYLPMSSRVCQNHYVYLDSYFALIDCTDTIVETPLSINEVKENIDNHLAYYNDFNALADTYYYFIPRSTSFDFEKGVMAFDGYEYLKKTLKGKYHIAQLEVNDLADYQKYFFKTDHHWNNVGAYQGYQDIMKLLGKEDEIRPILSEVTIKKNAFVGLSARSSKQLRRSEKFNYYTFNLPKFYMTENGFPSESVDYNYQGEDYKYANYYSIIYDGDRAEFVYDFKNPDEENIMIFASSYSNPINVLIASHFNKTYVVDARHYPDFDYKEYIKSNDIDKILVLASTDVITGEGFNIGDDEDAL